MPESVPERRARAATEPMMLWAQVAAWKLERDRRLGHETQKEDPLTKRDLWEGKHLRKKQQPAEHATGQSRWRCCSAGLKAAERAKEPVADEGYFFESCEEYSEDVISDPGKQDAKKGDGECEVGKQGLCNNQRHRVEFCSGRWRPIQLV